jgi:hypothetical protein
VWCNTVYQALCHIADGHGGQLEVLNSVKAALHRSPKTSQQSTTPSIHLLIHLHKKQQKYLKNTLAALRCQDYHHWYLSIIADFTSTDTALWDIPNIRWLQIESHYNGFGGDSFWYNTNTIILLRIMMNLNENK